MMTYRAVIWLFKVINFNTRTVCKIYSKLTVKTPKNDVNDNATKNNATKMAIIPRKISDALPDLVPSVQFKKREKHPLGSDKFRLLKVTLLHRWFSRFLNRTNGTKSRKASHMEEIAKSLVLLQSSVLQSFASGKKSFSYFMKS